jgi:hypothetical protein
MISFDPSFDSTGYQLLISADQVPPVPEPAETTLLLAGLTSIAAFGVARRRRFAPSLGVQ